jgi:hypothetical protein
VAEVVVEEDDDATPDVLEVEVEVGFDADVEVDVW